jgi:hypothetical protein
MAKDVNIVLTSGSYVDRKRIICQVKESIGEHELFVFDEEDYISRVAEDIRAYPMFGQKRLIILNAWPKSSKAKSESPKILKQALQNLHDDCVVVLNNVSVEKGIRDFVADKGKVFSFPEKLSLQDGVRRAAEFLEKRDKSISIDDATSFVRSIANTYGDPVVSNDDLYLLVTKLLYYMGDRKKISEADVIAICIDKTSYVIWQLFDLLDTRKYADCMSLLHQFFLSHSAVEDVATSILMSMHWRYKFLWIVKDQSSRGKSDQDVIKDVSSLIKLKRVTKSTGFLMKMEPDMATKEKPKALYSEKAVSFALRGGHNKPPAVSVYKKRELFVLISMIVESILKVRAGASSSECLVCLDSICMFICGIADDKMTRELRAEYRYSLI